MHDEPAELRVDHDCGEREPAFRGWVLRAVDPDVLCSGADDVGTGREADRGGVSSEPAAVVEEAFSGYVELEAVRHADEAGDVLGGGLLEDLLGGVELLDPPGAHDREPVAEGERLGLVVGDEDGGEAEAAVQLVDLGAHLVAQPGVEVAQRLVEEDELGPGDEAAGQRDALLLAAAQLRRDSGRAVARSRPGPPSPRPMSALVALSIRRALSG